MASISVRDRSLVRDGYNPPSVLSCGLGPENYENLRTVSATPINSIVYTWDRQVSSPLRAQICSSARSGTLVLSVPPSSVYGVVSRGTNLGQDHADARSRLYSRLARRLTPSGYYAAGERMAIRGYWTRTLLDDSSPGWLSWLPQAGHHPYPLGRNSSRLDLG